MGLQEVMLARMKQSHGLSRPHAGSFARREQLPALPGTIRDAYALKQQRLAPASARPSYKQPPPRRRRRAAVDEREDTILKPRRASTWRERVAAPLRAAAPAARRQPEAPRLEPARRRDEPRLEPARRRPVEPSLEPARRRSEAPRFEPARRGPVEPNVNAQPARLTAAALAAHERQPRAPPAPTGAGRFVASPPRAREPPPREPPRPRQALPPIQKLPQGGQDRGPSKRFADRVSAAGKGVASKPDTAFFKQRRACWDKKIQFKYGKSDALSWERKAGDEKYDPSPAAPIDYEKHYRQLQTERAHNKQLRLKNSASTLRLGDHANDYWHSNHELFSGRVTGGELGRQRAENARKKRQLASSTLTLGDDPDYY